MEKLQQELKQTRLENRKFKDLATFPVQYDQHSIELISEYCDGFRTTSFKRKMRPTHCLQSADASFSHGYNCGIYVIKVSAQTML